jgi:D-alanyl-D-alanine carboxypeptidase
VGLSLPAAAATRRFVPASILALLLVAVAAAPAPAASSTEAADRALAVAMRRLVHVPGGPPGLAVVVQRGKRPLFRTAGIVKLGTHRRWRPSDHMRIASVAKAFSGAAALSLVSRGSLSLGDRIRTRLPWLPVAWADVTLGEALNHTSGLPDYSAAPAFQEFFAKNLHAYVDPQALVQYVADEPLEFPPGSAYHYSNTDNVVVGLIVGAVSGGSYGEFLRQRVFGPLGMPRTSLPAGFRLPAPFVHGYVLSPPKPPEDVTTLLSMSGAWASGGIQSTALELNRFIRGYVGRHLFDRATQRQQLRFVAGHSEPPGPGVNSAGLGIFRYRTDCGVVYGHTGNLPGYTQFTAATLDGRRSVTVSANAQLVPKAKDEVVRAGFTALRRVDSLAVCAALAGP